MIRSVARPHSRDWRRSHEERHRRAWILVGGIILIALLLTALGYFGPVTWVSLAQAVGFTTYRLAVAYGIALALGVTIALLVGWSPFTDFFFPIFDVLQSVPSFALIPVFIYLFGYTSEMIIIFAVSSIVWPILFAVLTAIKNAHADLNDAATIFGARGLRRIPFYLAPLAFPAILTGSIVGIAIGWEAVIGAEIIANIAGFGAFIQTSSAAGLDQAGLAGLVAILVIVFIVNRLVWTPLLNQSARRYAE